LASLLTCAVVVTENGWGKLCVAYKQREMTCIIQIVTKHQWFNSEVGALHDDPQHAAVEEAAEVARHVLAVALAKP